MEYGGQDLMVPEQIDQSEAPTSQYDEASKTVDQSQARVIAKSIHTSYTAPQATPVANSSLVEAAAFEMITIDCISENGGVESPFVNNTKLLVKHNLTHELIQAMRNTIDEAVAKQKQQVYVEKYYGAK